MWEIGRPILDGYEVVAALGSGGMATTYLVRQVDSGNQLAAKVPHAYLVRTSDHRLILANEVQVWISLPKHPHLVQCHYQLEVEGVPVVFAEYVEGGTLESWIARGRIASLGHLLDLGVQ